MTRPLLALALCLAAGQSAAVPLHELRGPWRDTAGNFIEIERQLDEPWREDSARWRGRLAHPHPNAAQAGFRAGQVMLRDIRANGDEISFEYAVRDTNPLVAQRCGEIFVRYTGTYLAAPDGGIKIAGDLPTVEFETPWEAGEPCKVTVHPGRLPHDLVKAPRRDFALRNLEVAGLFHCPRPDRAPPFAPFHDVSPDGHLRVFVPAIYFPTAAGGAPREGLLSAQLFAREGAGPWIPATGPMPLRLPRCTRPGVIAGPAGAPLHGGVNSTLAFDSAASAYPAHLDEVLPGFWAQLNQGGRDRVYQVRIAATTSAGGLPPFDYLTPEFTKDHLYRALEQRLDHLGRHGMRADLREFNRLYLEIKEEKNATDYAAARERFWRGLLIESTQLYATVEMHNFSADNDRLPVEVILQAELSDKKVVELGRQAVVLGAARENEAASYRAPTRTQVTVDFAPVTLGAGGPLDADALSRLAAVRVVAEPAWSGDAGEPSLRQSLEGSQLGALRGVLDIGAGMNAASVRPSWSRAAADAAARPKGVPDAGLTAAVQGAALFNDQRFGEYVGLHRIWVDFSLATGGTPLDALDRYVRRLLQDNPRPVSFTDPRQERSLTTGGSSGVPRARRFRLEQSGFNTGLAFISAMLNPNLSFALDPTLFPLASVAGNPNDGAGTLPGATQWVYRASSQYLRDVALRNFDGSPAMQEAYRRLTEGRGAAPRLSPELAQELRAAEFESVKGRLFEEVEVRARLMQDATRLAQERNASGARLYSEILVIGGHQVSGGSAGQQSGQELTDGLVLGKRGNTWHILRIAEAKSGQSSAQEIFGQFQRDAERLTEAPLTLQKLTADQRRALGTGSETFQFDRVGAPKGLHADFTNPDLFVPVVPADVTIRLPPPRPNEPESKRVAAIRRAMQDNLARSQLTSDQVERMTDLLFRQARAKPVAWHERHLSYDDFERLTRRLLPKPPPPQELERRFAHGERWDPTTGTWRPVFTRWERPVLSAADTLNEALEHWRRTHGGAAPSQEQVKRWEVEAREGKRFNVESGQFGSPATMQGYRRFILDPNDPSMSEAEIRIWLRHGSGLPAAEHAAFVEQWKQGTQRYDHATRRWTAFRGEEGSRYRKVRAFLRDNGDYTEAWRRRADTADKAADVVERVAAAVGETARVWREGLVVDVYAENGRVYVNVIPEVVINGRIEPQSVPEDLQKGLLQRYYRYSESFLSARALPDWLR